MKPVLVIGSSNTDMVIRLSRLPRPGQTISGGDFRVYSGGKGANQAIAARRAGGIVRFLGAVGDDDFGQSAIDLLSSEGIDTSGVVRSKQVASGVAMIFVSDAGENCIGVAPGANRCVTPESLASQRSAFDEAGILLIQLETPMKAVETALAMAARRQLPVILNPAPAAPLPDDLLQGLFCITPNETEAEALTGIGIDSLDDAVAAADALRAKGVQNVVITLGARGALLLHAGGSDHRSAEPVEVVDTTGAGDTFNGVLATMIVRGLPLSDAVGAAVRAATVSVRSAGAVPSIPRLQDL